MTTPDNSLGAVKARVLKHALLGDKGNCLVSVRQLDLRVLLGAASRAEDLAEQMADMQVELDVLRARTRRAAAILKGT